MTLRCASAWKAFMPSIFLGPQARRRCRFSFPKVRPRRAFRKLSSKAHAAREKFWFCQPSARNCRTHQPTTHRRSFPACSLMPSAARSTRSPSMLMPATQRGGRACAMAQGPTPRPVARANGKTPKTIWPKCLARSPFNTVVVDELDAAGLIVDRGVLRRPGPFERWYGPILRNSRL